MRGLQGLFVQLRPLPGEQRARRGIVGGEGSKAVVRWVELAEFDCWVEPRVEEAWTTWCRGQFLVEVKFATIAYKGCLS